MKNRQVGTQSDGNFSLFGALRPLQDRVLVRRVADGREQRLVTLTDESDSRKCEVVAAGPGRRDADGLLQPTQVKPGDVVLVSHSINEKWNDIVMDGEHALIQEADIMVVLEEAEARADLQPGRCIA